MSYNITIRKSAAKALEALPTNKIRRVVIDAIYKLADNPRPQNCKKLKGRFEELWRIRIGNYRVVYTIDDEVKILDIRDIGNRKDIYG